MNNNPVVVGKGSPSSSLVIPRESSKSSFDLSKYGLSAFLASIISTRVDKRFSSIHSPEICHVFWSYTINPFSDMIVAISYGSIGRLPSLLRIKNSPRLVRWSCVENGISNTSKFFPSTFILCGISVIVGSVRSCTWWIRSNTFFSSYMKSLLISLLSSTMPINKKPPLLLANATTSLAVSSYFGAKFFNDFPNVILSSNCSLKSMISHSPRSSKL